MTYHHTPVRMAKIQKLNSKAGEDVRNRSSHSFSGMQNGKATFKETLAVSYKAIRSLMMQSRNFPLWYLHQLFENYIHLKPACGCLW